MFEAEEFDALRFKDEVPREREIYSEIPSSRIIRTGCVRLEA